MSVFKRNHVIIILLLCFVSLSFLIIHLNTPNNNTIINPNISGGFTSSAVVNHTMNEPVTSSEKDITSADDTDKKLLYQCLNNSIFQGYADYQDLQLSDTTRNLCALTEITYKQFWLKNNFLSNDTIFNSTYSNPFSALIVDRKNLKDLSSGLFCCKVSWNEYDLVLLDFTDPASLKATHIGLVSTDTKESVDKLVKLQKFYQDRANQIAATFGIDLSDYLKASTTYDPPYSEENLVFLKSALGNALLTGATIDGYENFDNHLEYFLNKDYSGGIILNSNENGMQYLHKFSINSAETGKERFKITETKQESREPIISPDSDSR